MKHSTALLAGLIALSVAACGQGAKISTSPSGVGIVNGDPVSLQTDEAAQHVVGLVFNMPLKPGEDPNDQPQNICTGTLVSQNIVLTAAHCAILPYTEAFVIFSTKFDGAGRGVVRKVIAKSVNDKYAPQDLKAGDIGDTAILKFAGDVPEGYSPATLLDDASLLTAGGLVLEMGYGMSTPAGEDKGVGTLLQATVQILDSTSAKSEVLTDESHGQGVCEGDSGGPAFLNVNGKYLLWGVASRVFGVKPTPENPHPVVLCNRASLETDIVPWMSWLKAAMAGLGGGQPQVGSTTSQMAKAD